MGADESVGGATLAVGPASGGMMRVLVDDGCREIPMDFEPDAAEKIASEPCAAAERARAGAGRDAGRRAGPARPTRSDGGGRQR